MATLRNGIALLILLVATAFVATTGAGQDDAAFAAVAPPPTVEPKASWEDFIAHTAAQQSTQGAEDTTVTTQAAAPKGYTITVGPGGYKNIQLAVNSIPKGNTRRVIIYIKNGVYRQKVLVNRDNVYFKCQSRKVVLTWGDTAASAGGTSKSASTAIEANGFIASDCTFVNSAPAPPGGAVGRQAVALRIQGDMGAFYRCGFYGAQDTLYDKLGRHYFRSCYIVGNIDYIFGNGQSYYEYCNLQSIAKGSSGSITAQNRESNSLTGFVFYQCNIFGTGIIYLGRAWGTHSRVVFIQCYFANIIQPIGWQDWNDPTRHATVFYAEYRCTGPGANRKGRATWSKVLTPAQAAYFSNINFINGKSWLLGNM